MRATPALASSLLLSLLLALGCGGDDDGGASDGNGDAGGDDGSGDDASPGSADAADGEAPDGAPAGSSALGEACSGEGQGTCPDGFECFALSTGTWCSKRCTPGDDAVCQDGYDGPGLPLCLIEVTANEDPRFRICGVLCEDDRIGICEPEVCNGTCPAALDCTGVVMDKSGPVGVRCE